MNKTVLKLFLGLCMGILCLNAEATPKKRPLDEGVTTQRSPKKVKINDENQPYSYDLDPSSEAIIFEVLHHQSVDTIRDMIKDDLESQKDYYTVATIYMNKNPELMYKFFYAIQDLEFFKNNKRAIYSTYLRVVIANEAIGKKACDDMLANHAAENNLHDRVTPILLYIYNSTKIDALKKYIEGKMKHSWVSINGTNGTGSPIINNLSISGDIDPKLLEGNWYENLNYLNLVGNRLFDPKCVDKFKEGFSKIESLIRLEIDLDDTELLSLIIERGKSLYIEELYLDGHNYEKGNFSDGYSRFCQSGKILLSALESNLLNVNSLHFGEEVIFSRHEIDFLAKYLGKAKNVTQIKISVDIHDINEANDHSLTDLFKVPMNYTIHKILTLISNVNLKSLVLDFKSPVENDEVENYLRSMGKIAQTISTCNLLRCESYYNSDDKLFQMDIQRVQ